MWESPTDRSMEGQNSVEDLTTLLERAHDQCFLLGNYQAAILHCRHALNIDPNSSDAFCISGIAHLKLNSLVDAFADFNQAIRLEKTNFQAYLYRACLKKKQGLHQQANLDFKLAKQLCNKSVAIDHCTRVFISGLIAYQKDEYRSAAKFFRYVLEHDPNNFIAHYHMGSIHFSWKKYRSAIHYHTQAILINAQSILRIDSKKGLSQFRHAFTSMNIRTEVGVMFDIYNSHRSKSSPMILSTKQSTVDESRSNFVIAFLSRGHAYSMLDQQPLAIKDYSTAIKLNTLCVEAYVRRGVAYKALNNEFEALQNIERAIELNPSSTDAYYQIARLNYSKENYQNVRRDCDIIFEINPHHTLAHILLGDTAFSENDFENAIRLAMKCDKFIHNDSETLYQKYYNFNLS